MLQVTIPFTEEVVFDATDCLDNQLAEVTVNRSDEVRGAIELKAKTFKVDEITVYHIALKCKESVLVSASLNDYAWITCFTLSGQLEVLTAGADQSGFPLVEQTYFSLMPPVKEQMDVVINGDVALFIVCLTGDTLKNLLTGDEEVLLQQRSNDYQPNLKGRATTVAMTDIINSILNCIANNCLHRVFLAAKTLELLFLDLQQLNQTIVDVIRPTVNSNDLEKLEAARVLIEADMQLPCSLIELAHKVGLNDFKLKKGFKEVFGYTVFGYLSDLRMEKAKAMLSLSKYTVSEISHEVGYKNPHHFTAAFKKKFGYLPSKVKR